MRISKILSEVAAQHELTLSELEVYTIPPSAVLETARHPEGPSADSVEAFLDQPFKDYLAWLLAGQFSGSCGATSGWLDEITSTRFNKFDKKGGLDLDEVKSSTFLNKFLFAMISNKKRWYCRCTLKVHSFFIECIERKVCVYQSYFGHYSLAASIGDLREMDRMEFMPLLEAAVHDDMTLTYLKMGTDENWDELSEEAKKKWEGKYRATWAIAKGKRFDAIEKGVYEDRKKLFRGQSPVHDLKTVQYRINTNPAPVDEIRKNITQSLKAHEDEWRRLLASQKTVRQLLDG